MQSSAPISLRFLNHSCYIAQHGDVRLICDPWFEGLVFNNGWKLVCETPFRYEDFAGITHLWFSHEHPDHFNPPNLRKIPEAIRRKITVLFQVTPDKRVVNFCREMGFKEVVELAPQQWYPLSDTVRVLCERYQEGDSWLAFKTDRQCVLNLNDCGVRHLGPAREILRQVGEVDVLLTQYSYAYWVGNPDETALRREVAARKLQEMKFQIEVFRPRYTIPFASAIWFCHEENFYLNDAINRPADTFDFICRETNSIPIVLYGNDVWEVGSAFDSSASVEKYRAAFESALGSGDLVKSSTVEVSALQQAAKNFTRELRQHEGWWARMLLRPTRIFLSNFGSAWRLSLDGGLQPVDIPRNRCDIALSAENLLFCFRFPFGQDTLGVNGRFQKPAHGNYRRFYNFFRINQQKSRGVRLGLGYLGGVMARRLLRKLPFGLAQSN